MSTCPTVTWSGSPTPARARAWAPWPPSAPPHSWIARWEGALFLAYYAAYVAWLILAAQHNGLLGTYATVMTSFVLPLTLVTLVVMLIRRPRRP